MEGPNFSKSLNIRGASVMNAMLAALLCCEIRHEDVSRMQGGRHVTVVTLHCSRSRILLGELSVYLSISVSQSQSQMFQIWDADQTGLVVVGSVSVLV